MNSTLDFTPNYNNVIEKRKVKKKANGNLLGIIMITLKFARRNCLKVPWNTGK